MSHPKVWSSLNDDYIRFAALFKKKTGIDLVLYKEDQMRSRLTGLMKRSGFDALVDFYYALATNETLLTETLEHLTCNESEFYRNAQRWSVLEQRVLPEILHGNERIKCWSAACSTGEEPYSLAIMLAAFRRSHDIQVLATDINQRAIQIARAGIYRAESMREVPKLYLDNYFALREHRYAISEEIKRCVRFKSHNLLADPFEGGFHLIVCRHLLNYLKDKTKEALLGKFSRALKKGGFLFIGEVEQILQPLRYDLEPVDAFFYRKR